MNTPNRPRSGIVPPEVIASRPAPSRARTVPLRAVPHDPRTQLGERVARVAAGEHVEHPAEHVLGELGEGGRATHRREEVLDGPLLDGGHRDQLLREHVERVARVARGLDVGGEHPLGDHRRLEQVPRYFGISLPTLGAPTWWPARPIRCSPLATESGRLDLHDEVDRAHVDPELERGRRDDRAQPSRLERVLDLDPLLARERAVVRAREVLSGQLVQLGGETLGGAPVVDEHDRRAVPADQVEQHRMDRRPDRHPVRAVARPHRAGAHLLVDRTAELGHVLDRHDDLEVERFAHARVDHRDVARRVPALRTRRGTARSPPAGAAWPTARSAGTAVRSPPRAARARASGARRAWSRRSRGSRRRSPWSTPRSVSRAEDVSIRYKRLGRRDQDVGRVAEQSPPFPRVGVAGADADGRVRGASGAPRRSAACWIPASGERRFFSTSTASARRGET